MYFNSHPQRPFFEDRNRSSYSHAKLEVWQCETIYRDGRKFLLHFLMLKAIFYARFHPERGPSVIHQYPNHSIVSHPSAGRDSLLNFSDITSYIIPTYDLCDRPLSIGVNGLKVLGFPISIEDEKYERNRFTFNVCFVLRGETDATPWNHVVSKTAAFFKAAETEDALLQREEDTEGLKWAGDETYPAKDIGIIHALLKSIWDDLNKYGETCICISEHHVLNLRLATSRPAPTKVKAWDVPLLVRPLPEQDDWTWDLTVQRIFAHIDGVKYIQRIAELADVEVKLVKRAIRELLYHKRVVLLDIFHFQAIYITTSDLTWFVQDETMQKECAEYITVKSELDILSPRPTIQQDVDQATNRTIIDLYRGLGPGITVQEFYLVHETRLGNIDIRRFITFGVMKGFLRRIHKYALAIGSQAVPSDKKHSNGSGTSKPRSSEEAAKEMERAWKKAALTSGWATPPTDVFVDDPPRIEQEANDANERFEEDTKLGKFLDGKHCMDEICVAVHLGEKKVIERLRNGRFGEIIFFCK